MGKPAIRDRVIEEVKLIPKHRLSEVYDFIHYFRMGLQESEGNGDKIMKFAGCWKNMPEETFNEFLQEIAERRRKAFSRRRKGERGDG
ncbi:MAG: hypothetical protein HY279_08885 [Nitrospinae bacterium]|nr:hypothetical protein [Nitrospinota bacterium]